jgi:hypothetical protein
MAARFGLTLIPTFPGLTVTVMVAGALLAGSVTDAAVKITVAFEGTLPGPV